jgi:enolase-phosphatase E1
VSKSLVPATDTHRTKLPSGILLDIEGTTSSISFVYDQMFPFVRRELRRFLEDQGRRDDVQAACRQIAQDAGYDSLGAWRSAQSAPDLTAEEFVARHVLQLMDSDVKATGLKQLQGLIWEQGFAAGELRAHVYDDVPGCLQRWHQAGHDLRIFSSGSVQAQRLFFRHTTAGDLRNCFRDHYDTTLGSKRDAASYATIARAFDLPPHDILFLSDVPAELDAARRAGLQTCLVRRPGNGPVSADCPHRQIHCFTELE